VKAIYAVLAAVGAAITASCHMILGLEEAVVDCRAESITCPCEADSDCGVAPGECRVWKCLDGVCRKRNAPEGARCSTGFCDGADGAEQYPIAQCVACTEDSHCAGGYCGEFHRCGRCDNGIRDGDEWGIDCGGRCLTCLGNSCSSDEECISGFCTDGDCCDSRCHDECAYCAETGECRYLPQFWYDNDPICDGMMTCNGGGLCSLRPGELCASDVQCASLKCEGGLCTGP
jgi:hypothetical protein